MFQWMESLAPGIVAQAVLAISIVAAVGLALGSLGFRGIRLGTAGVLFVGIFFGQLGMHIDERILEFVRRALMVTGWPVERPGKGERQTVDDLD